MPHGALLTRDSSKTLSSVISITAADFELLPTLNGAEPHHSGDDDRLPSPISRPPSTIAWTRLGVQTLH
jgi:hypothetical protein